MELTELITSLGFPAAVAAFALYNSYKHEQYLQDVLRTSIDENTKILGGVKEAIILLKQAVDRITDKIEEIDNNEV